MRLEVLRQPSKRTSDEYALSLLGVLRASAASKEGADQRRARRMTRLPR